MEIPVIKRLLLASLCGAALFIHLGAQAQPAWPNKPVKVVVASAGGSATDIVARVFTEAFTKAFGHVFEVVHINVAFSRFIKKVKNFFPLISRVGLVRRRQQTNEIFQSQPLGRGHAFQRRQEVSKSQGAR